MNNVSGKILVNKSILKMDKSKTEGLRVAFRVRVSDPSMLRKKRGKQSRDEAFNELCSSIQGQIDKMRNAAQNLKLNVVKIFGADKHQHTTKQFARDISEGMTF